MRSGWASTRLRLAEARNPLALRTVSPIRDVGGGQGRVSRSLRWHMLAPVGKKQVSVANGRLGMKVSIKFPKMTEAGLQDEVLNTGAYARW